jgi:hypothetical protein
MFHRNRSKAVDLFAQGEGYQLAWKNGNAKTRVFRIMSLDTLITPGPWSFQYEALQKAGSQLMVFQTKDPYVRVLPE